MSLQSSNRAQVPELDLGAYINGNFEQKQKFSADLFNGLKSFGFVVLKNHPIKLDLLEESYSRAEEFFKLPQGTKMKYLCGPKDRSGYTPFGIEKAKGNLVFDLKEFWHVGQFVPKGHIFSNLYRENIWPFEIENFQTIFENLFRTLDDVAQIMLEALTDPLEVPKDYFLDLAQYGNSILRLLHYPPVEAGSNSKCVRAAAHEDINLITLLVNASSGGLEILDRDGVWRFVETGSNNIIVDSGDMLSRITNNLIPSTTHRVVNPEGSENISRYSMPYFIHAKPDAVLSCIESCKGSGAKYSDILSKDFLMERLREIGLA